MRIEVPYARFIRDLSFITFAYPLAAAVVASIIFRFLPAQWFSFLPDAWLHPGVIEASKIPHKISVFIYLLYGIFFFSVLHCLVYLSMHKSAKDYLPMNLKFFSLKVCGLLIAAGLAWLWKWEEIDRGGVEAKRLYSCQERAHEANRCYHYRGGFMFTDDVDRDIHPFLFYSFSFQLFLFFFILGTFGQRYPKFKRITPKNP